MTSMMIAKSLPLISNDANFNPPESIESIESYPFDSLVASSDAPANAPANGPAKKPDKEPVVDPSVFVIQYCCDLLAGEFGDVICRKCESLFDHDSPAIDGYRKDDITN